MVTVLYVLGYLFVCCAVVLFALASWAINDRKRDDEAFAREREQPADAPAPATIPPMRGDIPSVHLKSMEELRLMQKPGFIAGMYQHAKDVEDIADLIAVGPITNPQPHKQS